MCSRWWAYSSRTGCGLKGFCARPQRRNASVPHALYSNNEQSHIRIQLSSSLPHTHTHTLSRNICYITKHMHKVHSVLHMHKCMMHRYMQAYNGRHQNENTSIHDPRQQEENTQLLPGAAQTNYITPAHAQHDWKPHQCLSNIREALTEHKHSQPVLRLQTHWQQH